MTRRGIVFVSIWAVLTLAAIVWLAAGNFSTEFGPVVMILTGASLGFGPGRIIALRRIRREDPVEPRMVPLRVCGAVLGMVAFGPLVAAMIGWIGILTAGACFLVAFILMPIVAALFSDGYQGLWLDALVFHRNLTPPEDDWVLRKR